jgi:hypothetical protein
MNFSEEQKKNLDLSSLLDHCKSMSTRLLKQKSYIHTYNPYRTFHCPHVAFFVHHSLVVWGGTWYGWLFLERATDYMGGGHGMDGYLWRGRLGKKGFKVEYNIGMEYDEEICDVG